MIPIASRTTGIFEFVIKPTQEVRKKREFLYDVRLPALTIMAEFSSMMNRSVELFEVF